MGLEKLVEARHRTQQAYIQELERELAAKQGHIQQLEQQLSWYRYQVDRWAKDPRCSGLLPREMGHLQRIPLTRAMLLYPQGGQCAVYP